MPFVKVRDLETYYEVRGDGPPVLFIGGTGGDLRRKPSIFDGPMAAEFRVLAYDQRGLGQTKTPGAPCEMADFAEAANALLDALGWEACGVFGVSFGGMVAQEFAIRLPERVVRLVLACTSSGGAGGSSYPIHELADLDVTERAERVVALADKRRDEKWRADHPDQFQAFVQMAVAQMQTVSDGPDAEIGERRQLEARRGHDCYDRLPTLRMPVYVCGGKYDGVASVENQEALASQIPHARMELFEGGHLFLLEDHRASPQIVEFLKGDAPTEVGKGS